MPNPTTSTPPLGSDPRSPLNDMKNVCNSVPEVVEGWCYRYVGNGGSRHRIRYRCQKHPRNSCMNYANIYYSAVNSFGKGAYDDAQKANGCCDDKK